VRTEACENGCHLKKQTNKKTNKQGSIASAIRIVSCNDKVRNVGDSDKNWDTKVGYLNNGMSRLDTKSRTAPFVKNLIP